MLLRNVAMVTSSCFRSKIYSMAQKIIVKSTKPHQNHGHPVGNTGSTFDNLPVVPGQESARLRANIELSASVSLCLDHVCEATGATRSQLINSALLEALPGLIERADMFVKRAQVLAQVKAGKLK